MTPSPSPWTEVRWVIFPRGGHTRPFGFARCNNAVVDYGQADRDVHAGAKSITFTVCKVFFTARICKTETYQFTAG